MDARLSNAGFASRRDFVQVALACRRVRPDVRSDSPYDESDGGYVAAHFMDHHGISSNTIVRGLKPTSSLARQHRANTNRRELHYNNDKVAQPTAVGAGIITGSHQLVRGMTRYSPFPPGVTMSEPCLPAPKLSLEELLATVALPQADAEDPTPLELLDINRASGKIKTAQYITCSLLLKRIPSTLTLSASTPLTEEQILDLDYALADDRITPEDFVRRYNGPPAIQASVPAVLLAALDNVQLFSDHVRVDGERLSLADITSVRHESDHFNLNLVRLNKSSHCTIKFAQRAAVTFFEDGVYFKDRRHAALVQFGAAVAQATLGERTLRFFRRLQQEGKIRVSPDGVGGLFGASPGVYLTVDGHAQAGDMRINLQDARAHGEVLLGVHYQAANGVSREYRPNEIAISLKKKAWYKPLGGIVFSPTVVDADVVHYAVEWLCKHGGKLALR